MIWVIAANAVTCRIFEYNKHPEKLTILKEIEHPENRLKKEDYLTSDKPGHYKSSASNRGAYSPRTDPKEVEIDNFARQIAKELDHGRKTEAYKELIIITTPHMDGLICQHIDKHVKNTIRNNIQKDPQHVRDHELLSFLHTHTEFPDSR
jgi:protein required for attachment to host cells